MYTLTFWVYNKKDGWLLVGGLYTPPWILRRFTQNMQIPYGVHTDPCGILTLHLSNSTRTPRNLSVRVRQGPLGRAIFDAHQQLPSTTSPPSSTAANHLH